jgi:hypothetical protein
MPRELLFVLVLGWAGAYGGEKMGKQQHSLKKKLLHDDVELLSLRGSMMILLGGNALLRPPQRHTHTHNKERGCLYTRAQAPLRLRTPWW